MSLGVITAGLEASGVDKEVQDPLAAEEWLEA
jgi:hypothetical protein